MQSWTFHQVIMNPWTRAEIEYVWVCSFHDPLMLSPLQHSANTLHPSQPLHDVLQRYNSLGPTACFCFELTCDEVIIHISDLDRIIYKTSPDDLKNIFKDSSWLSLDTLSHKICLVRHMQGSALGNRGFTTEFISATVREKVEQRLEHFSDEQLLDIWNMFLRFGEAQGMTGSIFEVWVHWQFKRCIDLHATPMLRLDRANSRWHASATNDLPLPTFMEWHGKTFLSKLMLAPHTSTTIPPLP